ncbi:NAD(P)/FAD-dependent oxidoreductase [Streptomyces sp. NPDC090026]|uniref:NAD(P)/FAD-dependent oxidoreductase n=1 Tax=Streptomyces sp. NPDC090026 TaxID=3365923 RepID=UPI00382670BE
MTATQRRRVAVVGGGVAGLTAAYILQRACDVTLFEADDRLGGHAHTHEVPGADGRLHRVDSGFIVHNERTYPLLLRLFAELGVATQDAEMSMSVRCEGCGLEYAGARGPAGLFARPGQALRPRYLRMLTEVPRFHRRARRLLDGDGGDEGLTVGRFIEDAGFSPYFRAHFMAPVVSCVWSCDAETALRYPALHLFRFLDHHGMLGITGSPVWRTVTGGSREYVDRIAKQLTAVRTGTPVCSLRRYPGGAEVTTGDGVTRSYDGVVVATHPDQALRLLADASGEERRTLGAFTYSRNTTVLHTDASLLPRTPGARASWNFSMPGCDAGAGAVRVSYDMNRLQRIDAPERHVVTLNGSDRVPADRVLARMEYEHPVFTPESVAAQRHLPGLSGPVTAFAGAYHGWGFHEDGCRSGVLAARALGVTW